MPQYVIERHIPGAGAPSPDELRLISRKACAILDRLGPRIRWHQSLVTDDCVYCVYSAESEALVYEHSREGGFPISRVSEVRAVIDPTTAL